MENSNTEAEQTRQTVLTGNKNDGNLSVSFSDNDLEAHADFMPPIGNGAPLTPDVIKKIFEKLNIVYGARWDAINEAMMECNLDHKMVKDVIIARGDPPSSEVAEYFEINPHLIRMNTSENRSAEIEGNARVDYRNRSPFIIVKKDQTLAFLRPRKTGKEGKNVHGTVLPFGYVRPEGVTGGDNTRTDEKVIAAGINGQLIETKNVLTVQDFLVIKGAVGYGTGNIIFPGDVTIEGPVSDGFKIYSGGAITIKQTFDVTDANSKGDLNVAGGIIGRGAALIKSGGTIRTKFIENCHVAARKTITVDSEIINSTVFTLENIDLGDKGLILGGDVYAVRGIRAGGIGKKAGKATRIHCGIDFTLQQEKEKNNNVLRILAAKLAKLREILSGDIDSAKREKMEELLHRLEEEQQKASSRVSDLLGQINTDENAAVEVVNEIVPGTLIEICQIALFVAEPLKHVRIRLDKASGKVISESL
ncbi:MAG: FapA family protein [Treponema sp.]|jgi:uncharacterized protein (DUF342 family)|nr:FapA family protein [Treponema sp.]